MQAQQLSLAIRAGPAEDDYEEVTIRTPLPVVTREGTCVGATYQVAVATTATLIAPANPRRKSIKITNKTGTQILYLGFAADVSSSNGDYLAASAGSSMTLSAKQPIYGIAISGAQTVTVLEESEGE